MHSVTHLSGVIDVLRLVFGLGAAALYLCLPFTAMRRLPIPRICKVSFLVFLLTAAMTNLGIGFGFAGQPWMVISDGIKFVAFAVFIVSFVRIVAWAMVRKEKFVAMQAARTGRPVQVDEDGFPIDPADSLDHNKP